MLEALRESRRETAEANGAKEGPATLIKGKFSAATPTSSSNTPGWIGDGTIPAVGYTDLSKPAAIPGRPSLPMARPNHEPPILYEDPAPPSGSSPAGSPALRVNSNSSDKTKSRGSSPERRKAMRTTLRNNDKKNGKKTKINPKKKESRPAASKAAGLAWGNLYRSPSSEKTVSEAAIASSRQSAANDSSRRDPDRRPSSGDEPSLTRQRPTGGAAADRIPAAHWREPQNFSPGRSSPRVVARSAPRQPPVSSETHRPAPTSGSMSMLEPTDYTAPSSSSNPSIKPKPVGLRSSLPQSPRMAQVTKSEGNSRPVTPRQDRDTNTSDPKMRTKSAPRTTQVAQADYISQSSGSDDVQRGVNKMTLSTANNSSATRRKPPPKQRETPPSSDQESWEQQSTDDEAEDEDEKDSNDIVSILKKLPKGVDLQSARQILNDIVVRGDEVHWDDIAGLDPAKKALKEAVVYPFLRPDLFSGLREPARGMLLFGPPGTGKTMLARSVATESKSTFFSVSSSSLTSKWHGESEKLVRALFGLAKVLAPSIIFVDEIDSLLSARSSGSEHEASRRSKTEFLVQWSDLQRAAAGREQSAREKKEGDASRVLVLAATNMPWDIDEAARRRFVRRQYIPLPEHHVREQQLRKLLSHQHHELSDADIQVLVRVTEGKIP